MQSSVDEANLVATSVFSRVFHGPVLVVSFGQLRSFTTLHG